MIKGLIRVTLFSAFLILVVYFLGFVFEQDILHPYVIRILVFYWMMGLILHILAHLAQNKLDMDLTLVLLAGVTGRLLIAIIAMVFSVVIGIPNLTMFIINFAVIYLFYLVFEITSVLSNLRSNLK